MESLFSSLSPEELWVQLKGGRPSFQMLLDLIKVSYDLHIKQRGGTGYRNRVIQMQIQLE